MAESEDVSGSTPSVLLIHLRWSVADADAAPLNEQMLTRLRSYIPRYAETLSARCLIVGGIHDHLHLLMDLPTTKSLQEVEDELRRASQRFLRDVLGSNLFLWSATGGAYSSVSPQEQEAVVQYIQTQAERHTAEELWDNLEATTADLEPSGTETMPHPNESLPEWLRSAMSPPTK
jgi:putative transposase